MGKLPDETALGGMPGFDSGRSIASRDTTGVADGAAALGKGVTEFGLNIAADNERRERMEVARGRADFLSRKIELDSQFSKDLKWDDHSTRYEKELKKIREEVGETLSIPRARHRYNSLVGPHYQRGVAGANERAYRLEKDEYVAGVNESLEGLRQSALKTQDQAERVAAIDTGRELINGLEARGFITQAQGVRHRKDWAEKYSIAVVEGLPADQRLNLLRQAPEGKEGVLDRIAQIESGGNSKAKNPYSSARGLFQFTDQTWLDTVKANRPDLANLSREQQLELRNDPNVSREMAGYLYDANARKLQEKGIEATPSNAYLAHFLGAGGAEKVLKADPNTPISEILSRDAIDANRKVLGGKTAGSVIQWASEKMGGAKVGVGQMIDFIPEEKRTRLLQATETELLRMSREHDAARTLEEHNVKNLIVDDVASVASTGQGVEGMSDERIRNSLGEGPLNEWRKARTDAHTHYVATNDLYALNDGEINARLEKYRPKPGEENYKAKEKIFGSLEKRVEVLRKARIEDPAASVDEDPTVKAAAADPANPKALYAARMAAQERAGIPEGSRSPITRAEALQMVAPLKHSLPGKEQAALKEIAATFNNALGDQAEKALAFALRAYRLDVENAQSAARLLKKVAAGEQVTTDDARSFDQSSETAAGDRAVTGTAAKPIYANVPAAAITALRTDPSLAGQFDAKYGAGASQQILKNYPVR